MGATAVACGGVTAETCISFNFYYHLTMQADLA